MDSPKRKIALEPLKRQIAGFGRRSKARFYWAAGRFLNVRTQMATLALVAVLQKSPAMVRVFNAVKHSIEPATRIFQKAIVTAAALGSYHAVSGATTATYTTTVSMPLALNVGEEFVMAFGVSNTMTAAQSWSVTGDIPPGLIVGGLVSGPMNGQGVFNDQFGTISGAPTQAGSYTLFVKPWNRRDAQGNTAEALQIDVTVNGAASSPPIVAVAIDDQSVQVGSPFLLDVASNFQDSDPLSFTATLDDDSPLPSWLNFNETNASFSGTPSDGDLGVISVKVTASDASDSVSDTFSLTVTAGTTPSEPVPTQIAIRRDGAILIASWTVESDQSYQLESTSDLNDPDSWAPLNAPVLSSQGSESVMLSVEVFTPPFFIRVGTDFQ